MMLVDGKNCTLTFDLVQPGSNILSIHCPTISFSTILFSILCPAYVMEIYIYIYIYIYSCTVYMLDWEHASLKAISKGNHVR